MAALTKGWAAIRISVLLAGLFLTSKASAQIRVAPIVIEAEAQQGQAEGVIELYNPADEAVEIEVYASPFTYNESGFVELESDPSDLTPYLFFSPQQLTIQSGQERRVRLTARLLPSLPEGEYRAVIFTQNRRPLSGNLDSVQVNIVPRVGILYFVRNGNTAPNLIPQITRIEGTNQQIELLIDNQGSASIRPSIQWQLSQDGDAVASGEIEKTVLVAGESRHVSINYDSNLTPGSYHLDGEIFDNSHSVSFSFDITIP